MGVSHQGSWPMRLSLGFAGWFVPLAVILGFAGRRADPGRWRLSLAALVVGTLVLLVVAYPVWFTPWLPGRLLYLQFPYRLMGPIGMMMVLAVSLCLDMVRGSRRALAIGVWAVTVVSGALYESRLPTPPGRVDHATLVPLIGRFEKGLTARYEYSPRDAEPTSLRARASAARTRLETNGTGWVRQRGDYETRVRLAQADRVVFPIAGYDFYRVIAGPVPVPSYRVDGLLAADLPAGTTDVRVERRLPPVVVGSMLLSTLAVAALALTLGRPHALWWVAGSAPSRRPTPPAAPPA